MKKCFLNGITVGVFLGGLVACAHKPIMPPTALTLAEFWTEQKIRLQKSKKISGKVSLRFDSTTEKISGSGRVVGLGEKRTRLELRDPLGRTRYLLVQVPEKVSVYVPSLKVLYEDRREGRLYFKRTLGYPFSTLEIRRMWLGVSPLVSGTLLENWHWDYSSKGFRAMKRGRDSTIELLLDGNCGAIREMKVTRKEGSYLVEYSDFEEADKIHFAHTVKLTLLNKSEKLFLEWDDFSWEASVDAKELSILDAHENTKKIVLR